jgi:hypothetical protein
MSPGTFLPYGWKAEDLRFLHVLLVWEVVLTSLLIKKRQSRAFVLENSFDGIVKKIDKKGGAFPYLICVCVSQTQIEKKRLTVANCPLRLKNS